jgi:hypothetical protein
MTFLSDPLYFHVTVLRCVESNISITAMICVLCAALPLQFSHQYLRNVGSLSGSSSGLHITDIEFSSRKLFRPQPELPTASRRLGVGLIRCGTSRKVRQHCVLALSHTLQWELSHIRGKCNTCKIRRPSLYLGYQPSIRERN